MGVSLYVTWFFSLAAFNILSLYLIFTLSIKMCLCIDLIRLILFGTIFASWIWMSVSLPRLGKFSTIMSSNMFERLLLNHANTPGFLALGGEEFNPGPETRLDRSELLCNKVLLKYKGDRESFWHRHQKGAKRVPPC